jgi:hypothetical protein
LYPGQLDRDVVVPVKQIHVFFALIGFPAAAAAVLAAEDLRL